MVVESIVPERFVSWMVVSILPFHVLCECPDSNPHFQSLVIALIPIWVPAKKKLSFLFKTTCHVGGVKPRTGAGECHPTLQHLALHFSCRSVLRRAKKFLDRPLVFVLAGCCNSMVFVSKGSCLT